MASRDPTFIPKKYRLKARIEIALMNNGCKGLTDMLFDFAVKVRVASSRSRKTEHDGWVPVSALNRMYSYSRGRKTSDSTRYRNIRILRDACLLDLNGGWVRWNDTGAESEEVIQLARDLQRWDGPKEAAAVFAAEAAHERACPDLAPGRNAKGQFLPRIGGPT